MIMTTTTRLALHFGLHGPKPGKRPLHGKNFHQSRTTLIQSRV
jgi:hypothetical protein